MNRRGFVTGVGTVAAAGAAAQALRGPGSGSALSGGLHADHRPGGSGEFGAKRNPVGTTRVDQSAPGGGLTLGYIPRSARFANPNALPVEQITLRNFWKVINARTAIGIIGYVPSESPTIERVDITVNYALDEPPFVAPFYAWQYVNVPGQYAKSSSPLSFTAMLPNIAAIDVSFQVRSATTGAIASGSLLYPIGGSGLGPGIYALAAPSPGTGGAPDWDGLTWGDRAGSLARLDGRAIDFDYICLVLSPTRPT